MATAYHNLSSYDADTMPDASGMKVAIAAAEWNAEITDALLKGAVDTLLRNGVTPSVVSCGEIRLISTMFVKVSHKVLHISIPCSGYPSSSGC